jgi:hypothetical protein
MEALRAGYFGGPTAHNALFCRQFFANISNLEGAMNSKKIHQWAFVLIIISSLLTGCGGKVPPAQPTNTATSIPLTSTATIPPQPKSGEWTATTEFGTLSFKVTPDQTSISSVTFKFVDYECGGATVSGELGTDMGTGIMDGKFNYGGGSATLFTFNGTFDASGTSASGNLTYNWPNPYSECSGSGTWTATPTK